MRQMELGTEATSDQRIDAILPGPNGHAGTAGPHQAASGEDQNFAAGEVRRLKGLVRRREQQLAHAHDEFRERLYTITHELKGPLAGIKGFLTLILDEAGEELSEESTRLLGRASESVEHALDLIQHVISYAAIDARQEHFERLDAAEIIDAAVDSCRYPIDQAHAEISIQPGMPEVFGHREYLTVVFANLIGNAIKYRRPRVQPVVEIGYSGEELFHKIYVRDNGLGMTSEQARQVFGLFTRFHRDRKAEGNGIGLSIVKKVLNDHGGQVWVESRKNRGSTFFVSLPRVQPRS